MNQEYTLRVPFQLVQGLGISQLEKSPPFQIDRLNIDIEHVNGYYVLKIAGFSSEQEAINYVAHIWSALAWTLLHKGTAFSVNLEIDKVYYPLNPEEAAKNLSISDIPDGYGTEGLPIIYPSDKNIRLAVLGSPQLQQLTQGAEVIALVTEALKNPLISHPYNDPKLRTALELYSAFYYERSHSARFLTLMIILETLVEVNLKPQIALDLLSKWHKEVTQLKSLMSKESDDYFAVDSLEKELLFRREMSIRGRIRALVHDTLFEVGNLEAKRLAADAVKAYDTRSTLVHTGSLPVSELRKHSRNAHKIVELVLKARFRKAIMQ